MLPALRPCGQSHCCCHCRCAQYILQWVGKVEEEDCLQHAYVVFIIALGTCMDADPDLMIHTHSVWMMPPWRLICCF